MPSRARLFSVEEARALVERLRPLLEQLSDASRELVKLREGDRDAGRIAAADGYLGIERLRSASVEDVEKLKERCRMAIARLAGLGVEVKDPTRGLIDFLHERDGDLVYLCYELPEETVSYWHRIEDGYAGRRPLED
jgi:hypothetical protein